MDILLSLQISQGTVLLSMTSAKAFNVASCGCPGYYIGPRECKHSRYITSSQFPQLPHILAPDHPHACQILMSAALCTPQEPASSCYMDSRIRCCGATTPSAFQSIRLFVSSCLVEACTYRKVSHFLRYVSFQTALPPSLQAPPDIFAVSAAIAISRSAHM